ncbi:MAG: hypothetical protein J5565_07055 [Muribaculaceae bacterium]|nr:hypothetical protein [Muribaculaceae bacterium]
MKKFQLYFIGLLLGGLALTFFTACSEDDMNNSIIPEHEQELDPTSVTYDFDVWLQENYLKPYNIRYIYRMDDRAISMGYNFIPAKYENARDLALLLKYMWFDPYDEAVGTDFLKTNAPRILHIIGSRALSGSNEVPTLSEGGKKINLFNVNNYDINNFELLRTYFFATMHHELTHLLHQKINYPREFNELTNEKYDSNWRERGGTDHDGVVNSMGFITKLASSTAREDFAEIIAQRITMSDEQWESVLKLAKLGWYEYKLPTNTTEYCSYFYYENNKSDGKKIYVSSKMHQGYKSNEAGDTLTLVENDADVYQKAVEPIDHEEIYDKDGKLVRVNHTDANGSRCVQRGSEWLIIDGKGKYIPIYVYPVEDEDEIEGDRMIEQKLEMASKWLKDQWNVDLEKLRTEVQKRQDEFKADPQGLINRLRKEAGLDK